MRLARGSGLDGLTAMSEQRVIGDGCVLLRPLLGVSARACAQRSSRRSSAWIEDPSNDAERFERVRMRKARALLAGLGLTNDKIALSARRLERAQAALDAGVAPLQANRAPRSARRRLCQLRSRRLAGGARGAASASARPVSSRLTADRPSRCASPSSRRLPTAWRSRSFEGATLGWRHRLPPRRGRPRPARAGPGSRCRPSRCNPATTAVWDGRFRVSAAADAGGARRSARPGRAGLRRTAPATRNAARASRSSRRHAARVLARRRINHRSRVRGAAGRVPRMGDRNAALFGRIPWLDAEKPGPQQALLRRRDGRARSRAAVKLLGSEGRVTWQCGASLLC